MRRDAADVAGRLSGARLRSSPSRPRPDGAAQRHPPGEAAAVAALGAGLCGWLQLDVWEEPQQQQQQGAAPHQLNFVAYKPRWFLLQGAALLHFRAPGASCPPGDALALPGGSVEREGLRSLLLRCTSGPRWLRRRCHRLTAEAPGDRDTWFAGLRAAAVGAPLRFCDGVGRLLQAAAAERALPLQSAYYHPLDGDPAIEHFDWVDAAGEPRGFGGARRAVLRAPGAAAGQLVWARYTDARFFALEPRAPGLHCWDAAPIAAATAGSPFLSPVLGAFSTRTEGRGAAPLQHWLVYSFVPGGPACAAGAGECAARQLGAELTVALEHLHSAGLHHGALSPRKMLLDAAGHLVLCGVGLRSAYADMADALPHRRPYVSPEARRGEPPSQSDDWWAAGGAVYLAACGAPPRWETARGSEWLVLPALSHALCDLLQRMLCPDPSARLRGAAALREHPFFAGTDWDAVRARRTPPPQLLPPSPPLPPGTHSPTAPEGAAPPPAPAPTTPADPKTPATAASDGPGARPARPSETGGTRAPCTPRQALSTPPHRPQESPGGPRATPLTRASTPGRRRTASAPGSAASLQRQLAPASAPRLRVARPTVSSAEREAEQLQRCLQVQRDNRRLEASRGPPMRYSPKRGPPSPGWAAAAASPQRLSEAEFRIRNARLLMRAAAVLRDPSGDPRRDLRVLQAEAAALATPPRRGPSRRPSPEHRRRSSPMRRV
eukprot:TRINITY_DN13864_c0_g3_i1.p1 TRINITY_DN13864_c0_g3~~TRINITY_DN13864_c0_g3_i1.p1  ORF type:complete len:721 (+),score=150.29 TRINITY_DN13864_c0_g3_i1:56-2218(+)